MGAPPCDLPSPTRKRCKMSHPKCFHKAGRCWKHWACWFGWCDLPKVKTDICVSDNSSLNNRCVHTCLRCTSLNSVWNIFQCKFMNCHWQVWLYNICQNSKPQCCPTILHRVVAHVLAFENNQIMIWKSVISFLSVNMGSVPMDLVPTVGNEGEQKTLIGLTNRQVVLRGCRKHAIMTCTQTVTTVTISSLIHKGSRIETIITIPESSTMGQPKVEWVGFSLPAPFTPCKIFCTGPIPVFGRNRNSFFWVYIVHFPKNIQCIKMHQNFNMYTLYSAEKQWFLVSFRNLVGGSQKWGYP